MLFFLFDYSKWRLIRNNMAEDNINTKLTEENYMVEDENGVMVPNYDLTMISFNDGDIVKGRVVKIEKDEVLVDIGFKSEGVIPVSELSIRNSVKPEEILSIDDELEIMVLQKEDHLLIKIDLFEIIKMPLAEVKKLFPNYQTVAVGQVNIDNYNIRHMVTKQGEPLFARFCFEHLTPSFSEKHFKGFKDGYFIID